MITLTPRERQFHDKLMCGFTPLQIAGIFDLHHKYVYRKVRCILEKKQVETINELLSNRIQELENLLQERGIDYD